MKPIKPHYNETKIELPKRQKIEEPSTPTTPTLNQEIQYNEPEKNNDFSKKRVRWVEEDRIEKFKYF